MRKRLVTLDKALYEKILKCGSVGMKTLSLENTLENMCGIYKGHHIQSG
jgi:hypothetical protein